MAYLISDRDKINVVIYKAQLFSDRDVEDLTGVSKSQVNYIWHKWLEHGTIQNQWRGGRPWSMNPEMRRRIVRTVRQNPLLTAADVARDGLLNPEGVHRTTITRELHRNGLFARRQPQRFSLSGDASFRRYQFGLFHENWSVRDWENVVFSDEVKLFSKKNGLSFIRLQRGETVPFRYIQQNKAYHGGIETLAWGSINSNGVGELVRIRGIVDAWGFLNILENHLDWYEMSQQNLIFQHDYCAPYTSRIVDQWFDAVGVMRLPWPTSSPDLNIIENVWSFVKDFIWRERFEINDQDHLWRTAVRAWDSEQLDRLIPRLYQSLPQRIRNVVRTRGLYIK